MIEETYSRTQILTAYTFAWLNLSGSKLSKDTPVKHFEEFIKLLENEHQEVQK